MTRVDSLQPRVVRIHETPTRVRLRIDGSVDHPRREALIFALATSPVVVSFRIAWSCRSVTVSHTAEADGVCRLVQRALQRDVPPPQRPSLPAAAPRNARRAASRRLLWCSLIGLALAILPTPGRPALAALRLALSIAVALVQHRARGLADAPAAARWADRMAAGAGLLRGDKLVQELLSGWLHGKAKGLLLAPVEIGHGAALLARA